MLGCSEGEVGIVYMTKIGRNSGMPLFSWWSEEVTAETLMLWRLKAQGLGVRKAPAQVVLQVLSSVFRKWPGAFSKRRGGLETAARTIF